MSSHGTANPTTMTAPAKNAPTEASPSLTAAPKLLGPPPGSGLCSRRVTQMVASLIRPSSVSRCDTRLSSSCCRSDSAVSASMRSLVEAAPFMSSVSLATDVRSAPIRASRSTRCVVTSSAERFTDNVSPNCCKSAMARSNCSTGTAIARSAHLVFPRFDTFCESTDPPSRSARSATRSADSAAESTSRSIVPERETAGLVVARVCFGGAASAAGEERSSVLTASLCSWISSPCARGLGSVRGPWPEAHAGSSTSSRTAPATAKVRERRMPSR